MGHQYPFINCTPANKVSCLKKHNSTFTIKLPLTIKLKLQRSNYFTKRAFAKSQAVLHAQTKKTINITLLLIVFILNLTLSSLSFSFSGYLPLFHWQLKTNQGKFSGKHNCRSRISGGL